MVVSVDWLPVFSIRWQHLASQDMGMDYGMNTGYFNRRSRMVFNAKNPMIGKRRENILRRYERKFSLGYGMEIHGKFLDRNIKFL